MNSRRRYFINRNLLYYRHRHSRRKSTRFYKLLHFFKLHTYLASIFGVTSFYTLFSDMKLPLKERGSSITSVPYFLPYFLTLDIFFNTMHDLYNLCHYLVITSTISIKNQRVYERLYSLYIASLYYTQLLLTQLSYLIYLRNYQLRIDSNKVSLSLIIYLLLLSH